MPLAITASCDWGGKDSITRRLLLSTLWPCTHRSTTCCHAAFVMLSCRQACIPHNCRCELKPTLNVPICVDFLFHQCKLSATHSQRILRLRSIQIDASHHQAWLLYKARLCNFGPQWFRLVSENELCIIICKYATAKQLGDRQLAIGMTLSGSHLTTG